MYRITNKKLVVEICLDSLIFKKEISKIIKNDFEFKEDVYSFILFRDIPKEIGLNFFNDFRDGDIFRIYKKYTDCDYGELAKQKWNLLLADIYIGGDLHGNKVKWSLIKSKTNNVFKPRVNDIRMLKQESLFFRELKKELKSLTFGKLLIEYPDLANSFNSDLKDKFSPYVFANKFIS